MKWREKSLAVFYHNLFDFPLKEEEILRWQPGSKALEQVKNLPSFDYRDGFYFLKGRDDLIKKRLSRKRNSVGKLFLARKSALALASVPGVKMVALTGSLAMNNAKSEADIDLLIITAGGRLWLTRLSVYCFLVLTGLPVRRSGKKASKDRLCLNIWLDEKNLAWPREDRNIYTAHEIAQIVPLMDKNDFYWRFMNENRWILDYWPYALKIDNQKPMREEWEKTERHNSFLVGIWSVIGWFLEPLAYGFQAWYMKRKISREKISSGRAVFHPVDLSQKVLENLFLSHTRQVK